MSTVFAVLKLRLDQKSEYPKIVWFFCDNNIYLKDVCNEKMTTALSFVTVSLKHIISLTFGIVMYRSYGNTMLNSNVEKDKFPSLNDLYSTCAFNDRRIYYLSTICNTTALYQTGGQLQKSTS